MCTFQQGICFFLSCAKKKKQILCKYSCYFSPSLLPFFLTKDTNCMLLLKNLQMHIFLELFEIYKYTSWFFIYFWKSIGELESQNASLQIGSPSLTFSTLVVALWVVWPINLVHTCVWMYFLMHLRLWMSLHCKFIVNILNTTTTYQHIFLCICNYYPSIFYLALYPRKIYGYKYKVSYIHPNLAHFHPLNASTWSSSK